jgi:hypothetical protein
MKHLWLLFFYSPRGYFRARRLQKARESGKPREEEPTKYEILRDIIMRNPDLHKRLILQGDRGVHYALIEDFARVSALAMSEAEINALQN